MQAGRGKTLRRFFKKPFHKRVYTCIHVCYQAGFIRLRCTTLTTSMKKKKDKICPQCNISYPPTRSDQIYCDDTCRWNAWRERKAKGILSGIPKSNAPDIDISANLRGVIDGDETGARDISGGENSLTDLTDVKILNTSLFNPANGEKLKEASAKKDEADTFIKRVSEEMKACDVQIRKLEKLSERHNKDTGTIPLDDEFDEISAGVNYQGPSDWIDFDFNDEVYSKEYMEEKGQKDLAALRKRKIELSQQLEQGKQMQQEADTALGGIDSEMKHQKGQAILSLLEGIRIKKMQPQVQNETNQSNVTANNEQTTDRKRVMNLREIKQLKFKYLDFKGRWKDFIGLPSTHFHLAIHGLPGQGKSTFCILFAEYLAENFGEVMYASGEQGFEKTLQDIINRTGVNSDKIDFSDPKTYEEVYTCIEKNKYNFIFIDSLTTLEIDAKRLKKLKESYPKSAFITISQSRKDGKMKGDNEILHDADTVIGVHKGIAITSKNRFNASDRQFEVFS